MTVVSDSSPLITLARIGCFDLLRKLYGRVFISTEVHREVVIDGGGLPGATEVARADWVEVRAVLDVAGMTGAIPQGGLGIGELSAVFLAKELSADLVLIDEWRARRYALSEGLPVIGCVGILEDLYEQEESSDLRGIYQQLIHHKTRIDRQTLQHSLTKFKLPRL